MDSTLTLSNTAAQAITHVGGGAAHLTIKSTNGNTIVETVTFADNVITNVDTLTMSGDLTNSAGSILLTSANAKAITHTGGSGNLEITSGSNVEIESVMFNAQ